MPSCWTTGWRGTRCPIFRLYQHRENSGWRDTSCLIFSLGAGVEGHELPHLHISPASLSKQTSQRPLPSNPNQQHNSTSTSAQNKQTHAKHSKNHRQTKTNQNKTKHSKKHKYQNKQILQLRNSIIHTHKPTHEHTHTKAPTKKRKGRFMNKFNSKRRRLMKIALEGPPSGSAGQPRELARC